MTDCEKNKLIVDYMPLAKSVALNMKKTLPLWIDIDELVGVAYYGLVVAAQRFKSELGSFSEFARARICGEIKNFLKRNFKIRTTILEQDIAESSFNETHIRDKFVNYIDEITSCLNAMDKNILFMYYIEELSMLEIGLRVNLSESRISQLISSSTKMVRGQAA